MFKTDFFDKNIEAMKGEAYSQLKIKLKDLQFLKKYQLDYNSTDVLDSNIFDIVHKINIYKEPLKELQNTLKPFEDEFLRYPCLFFYGIGTGFLYKVLAQNTIHRRIVIFEKELELIYLALNLNDFSEFIAKGVVIIIHSLEYDFNKANRLFSVEGIALFFKLYKLHILSEYYESYIQEIKKINDINIKAIKNLALKRGNDPADALIGIEHYALNLAKMLTRPKFSELLKKRKDKYQSAIFVATGPSLSKQLPQLKKVQDRAVIFCADSSYTLLQKQGIKPDYVLSLERIAYTSEFFNNDFKDFDKDILFILFALTHPKTLHYLEKNKRNYMLLQRSLPFAKYFNFTEFGIIGGGMSVMNMAHELALILGFKNLIFIGQDLAYSQDGKSHPDDYIYVEYEGVEKSFYTTAYGGEGEVKSTETWLLFKGIFENLIAGNKDSKFYNCTEGGARIEGSIEMPFKEACEKFFSTKIKKPLAKIPKPSRKESNEYMLKAYEKIKKGMRLGENFIKRAKKIQRQLQTLTRGTQKYTIDEINAGLDKIKHELEHKKALFFNEVLTPSLSHQESQFAPLYVQNMKNDSDKQNKLMVWIFSHEAWLEEIIDFVSIMNARIKIDLVPLREELEKRKLL